MNTEAGTTPPADQVAQDGSEAMDTAQQMVQTAQDVASGREPGPGLDRLMKVSLVVTAELGRSRMKIADIVNLGSGSVVELQKLASEPVDVMVNGTLFARGEVVVVEDHFAVKLTELADRTKIEDLT